MARRPDSYSASSSPLYPPDQDEVNAPLLSSRHSPSNSVSRLAVPSRKRWGLILVVASLVLVLAYAHNTGIARDGLSLPSGPWGASSNSEQLGAEADIKESPVDSGRVEEDSTGVVELEESTRVEDEWQPTRTTRVEDIATPSANASGPEGADSDEDGDMEDQEDDRVSGVATDSEIAEEEAEEDGELIAGSDTDDDDGTATTEAANSAPTLNVHPRPHLAPTDPDVARETRYLAYENHSGFHNQRKSLVNALLVAHILNRTLLLPPARLGYPAPWGPELNERLTWAERCKADTPAPQDDPCGRDPDKWTYVGWSYLVSKTLLAGRPLVDRWNSSTDWFTEDVALGGLGLEKDEIASFDDQQRRSYQLYDDRKTRTRLDLFARRIDLEDLMEHESFANKRLLHFGSLFSGARLNIQRPSNQAEQQKIGDAMILENDALDRISDSIRDQLGSYAGVHLRVGDGIFKSRAKETMKLVFRRLTKNVFGLRQAAIDLLLVDSDARTSKKRPTRHTKRTSGAVAGSRWFSGGDDGEEEETLLLPEERPSTIVKRRLAQRRIDQRAPLASSLTCRGKIHSEPHLLKLNLPIYIATDSRSPLTDPPLAPFFHHFPCAFLLDDFAGKIKGVNSEPIEELRNLVAGEWTSDWDGQGLARYLYPFLEAMIAARGIEVVGTPQSTFSGYASGFLHSSYRAQGMTAQRVEGIGSA